MDDNTKEVLEAIIWGLATVGVVWALMWYFRWILSATRLPVSDTQHVHMHYYEALEDNFDDFDSDDGDEDPEKEASIWN